MSSALDSTLDSTGGRNLQKSIKKGFWSSTGFWGKKINQKVLILTVMNENIYGIKQQKDFKDMNIFD